MSQGFPTPFMTPTLQPTQQLLSLKVLAGAGAETKVRRLGRSKEWELEVWEHQYPIGGALRGCGWGLQTWGRGKGRQKGGTEGQEMRVGPKGVLLGQCSGTGCCHS